MRQQLAPRRIEAVALRAAGEEVLEPRGVEVDVLLHGEGVGGRVGVVAEDGAMTLIIAELYDDAKAEQTYQSLAQMIEQQPVPGTVAIYTAGEGAVLGYLGAAWGLLWVHFLARSHSF